jgi:hypothetical protein
MAAEAPEQRPRPRFPLFRLFRQRLYLGILTHIAKLCSAPDIPLSTTNPQT